MTDKETRTPQEKWPLAPEIFKEEGLYSQLEDAKAQAIDLLAQGFSLEDAIAVYIGQLQTLRQSVDDHATVQPNLAAREQLRNFRNYTIIQEVLGKKELGLLVQKKTETPRVAQTDVESSSRQVSEIENSDDLPESFTESLPRDEAENQPQPYSTDVELVQNVEPLSPETVQRQQMAYEADVKDNEPRFAEWSKDLEARYSWITKLNELQGTYKSRIQAFEAEMQSATDISSAEQVYENAREVKAEAVQVWRIAKSLYTVYATFKAEPHTMALAADYQQKADLLKAQYLPKIEKLLTNIDKKLAPLWGVFFDKTSDAKNDVVQAKTEIDSRIAQAKVANSVQDLVNLWEEKDPILKGIIGELQLEADDIIEDTVLKEAMTKKILGYATDAEKLREKLLTAIWDLWKINTEKLPQLAALQDAVEAEIDTRNVAELEALSDKLNQLISDLQSSILIPNRVDRAAYDAQIEKWMSPARAKLKEISSLIRTVNAENIKAQGAFEKKLQSIQNARKNLEANPGIIRDIRNKGKDLEEDLYQLRVALENTPPELRANREEALNNLEKEVWKTEYKRIRHELLRQLNDLEAREPSGQDLSQQTRNYDDLYLFRMDELSKKIGESKYSIDADRCSKEKSSRLMLYYHWKFFWNVTSNSRRVPKVEDMKANETLPLSATDLDWLINEGLTDPDPEWEDRTNEKFAERDFQWKSRTVENGWDDEKFNPTAVGDVMRFIDDVYLGKRVIKTKSGTEISVLSLNKFIPDQFVEIIADTIIKEDPNTKITKEIVRRAFRLHWCATLHQSYLVADSNPQTADEYFYLFRWPRYLAKYRITGVDSSNLAATFLVWGMKGTSFFDAETNEAIRNRLKNRVVHANLKGADERPHETTTALLDIDPERKEIKGFGSYEWVLHFPIFKNKSLLNDIYYPIEIPKTGDAAVDEANAAIIERNKKLRKIAERDDGYSFASPLNFWIQAADLTDDEIAILEAGGEVKQKAQRMPDVTSEDGKVRKGAVITMDMTRSKKDHYIYERMNFKALPGNAIFDYILQLGNGPYRVLNSVLKLKSEKFLKDGISANFMSDLRNAWKYAVPFLPSVGPEIAGLQAGLEPVKDSAQKAEDANRLTNAAWNETAFSTILAFCLSQLDTSSEHVWNSNQFYSYLTELQKENVIDNEERAVLEVIAHDVNFRQLFLTTILRDFEKQLKDAAKFR